MPVSLLSSARPTAEATRHAATEEHRGGGGFDHAFAAENAAQRRVRDFDRLDSVAGASLTKLSEVEVNRECSSLHLDPRQRELCSLSVNR